MILFGGVTHQSNAWAWISALSNMCTNISICNIFEFIGNVYLENSIWIVLLYYLIPVNNTGEIKDEIKHLFNINPQRNLNSYLLIELNKYLI